MQSKPPQQLPNFCSKFLTWSHSLTEHSPRAPPDLPVLPCFTLFCYTFHADKV